MSFTTPSCGTQFVIASNPCGLLSVVALRLQKPHHGVESEKRALRPGELEAARSANDIFGGTPKITRGTRVLHQGKTRFPARGNSGALESAGGSGFKARNSVWENSHLNPLAPLAREKIRLSFRHGYGWIQGYH